MIYQVWGIEKGEKPPQILLDSFRLASDAEASDAADAQAEEWRREGATQVEVRIVPETTTFGDKAKVAALFEKHLELIEKEVAGPGWTERQQSLVGVLSEKIGRVVDGGIED